MKHLMQRVVDILLDVLSLFRYVAFNIFIRRTAQPDKWQRHDCIRRQHDQRRLQEVYATSVRVDQRQRTRKQGYPSSRRRSSRIRRIPVPYNSAVLALVNELVSSRGSITLSAADLHWEDLMRDPLLRLTPANIRSKGL